MTAGDFYRIEFRIQNRIQKYYLVREIFSDARKFAASRLITSGTPPTRTEINRCASLYGFDLELKCIAKATKYRSEAFRYDTYDDRDAVIELERHRLLTARRMQFMKEEEMASSIASYDVGFSADEISQMLSSGKIPAGKTLQSVNRVQNLANAWKMRGRSLSISHLYKLHAAVTANLSAPLSPVHRPALEKRLTEFSQKIRAGFYPFEQCVLLYQDLQEMLDSEEFFVNAVYAEALSSFGYKIFPRDAQTYEDAVRFVTSKNPEIEMEVRRLNDEMFKVKTGGKQKKLELY